MNWKRMVLIAVWAAAAAIWVGIAAYYVTAEPSLAQWAIAVTIGAVALEVAFWATAAILGVTLWHSRRAVLQFLTRPFRRGA